MLQKYELERVGSTEKISLNIKVIAATNKNLLEMMKAGKFREDLYYRISAINIELPPLRKQTSYIIPIAENHLQRLKQKLDTPIENFSVPVKDFFEAYEHCIEKWKNSAYKKPVCFRIVFCYTQAFVDIFTKIL